MALPSVESRMVALYSLTLVPMALGTRWVLTVLATTRAVALARTVGESLVLVAVTMSVLSIGDLGRVPLAQLLGDSVAALIMLLALRHLGIRIGFRWDSNTVRPLVRHVAPYVASTLLGLAIFNADLIFLRAFADRVTVGLYASAYALISFIINVGATYSLSLISPMTRLASEPSQRLDLYHRAWARAIALVLPLTVGGVIVSTDLLALAFGPSFAPAGPVLAILVVSVPLSVLRSVATSALVAQGREDILFRTVVFAAIANVAMNFVAVPLYGMRGAAVVTVLTEGLRMFQAQYYASSVGVGVPPLVRHWRAAAASLVMLAVLSTRLGDSPVLAAASGVVVYGFGLLALGGIGRGPDGRWQLQV
jgi:O-antigen/teichoic acid export membrane protein